MAPVSTVRVRTLAELVDEHRLITQATRRKGRRWCESRAHSITLELDYRAEQGDDTARELARLLRLERCLVITPVDVENAATSAANLSARVTARAKCQREIRALRARLGAAA